MSEPKFWIVKDKYIGDILHAKDLEAGNIDHAIAKWQYLVENGYYDLNTGGRDTCSLCVKWNNVDTLPTRNTCIGCPVYAKTQEKFCIDTPYDEITKTRDYLSDTAWRKLAQNELDFLIALKAELENIGDNKHDPQEHEPEN